MKDIGVLFSDRQMMTTLPVFVYREYSKLIGANWGARRRARNNLRDHDSMERGIGLRSRRADRHRADSSRTCW